MTKSTKLGRELSGLQIADITAIICNLLFSIVLYDKNSTTHPAFSFFVSCAVTFMIIRVMHRAVAKYRQYFPSFLQ